ncbi:cytochrome (ubi)quinol oxidase subunit III [Oleiagrimonas sp. C23AA]|uniref:cytochrome c oxidase subunit 3 n=1 Tax=Oleiagrimonas sp. C23AA TaxID=2719047 RepID=UPI0014210D79|nr:cytochrome (ubi)quinol oxidase subunit III [Oleiagrimonas sp. C23AA]
MSEQKHAGINLKNKDRDTHQQAESPLFGFWVFMMSDAVIFALLFATYGVMMHNTAGGPGTHQSFELKSAFIETVLLLVSSFTFGMASLSMKYRPERLRHLVGWLIVTLLLGMTFLGFELHDFHSMAGKGAVPHRSGFLSAFFALVSTHGLHVASGCVWTIIMLIQLGVFGLSDQVKTRIMRLGLFWHFLDIIWVGIFSVVYLQGLL